VFHWGRMRTGLAGQLGRAFGYAAWATNKSGEVGQPGRKGRGGPGHAGWLGRNGRRFGFRFKWNLSWVLIEFWSNEILEDF
jgi:hypothetical protein